MGLLAKSVRFEGMEQTNPSQPSRWEGHVSLLSISEKLTVRADLRYFHTNDQPSFVRLYGGVVFHFPR